MANSHFCFEPADAPLRLIRAGFAEIDACMALERGDGFEDCVGRSTRDEHERMLMSGLYAYFLGVDGDERAVAFAILRDLEDPHGNLYLKRIAVAAPGRGVGARFLALVLDWVFAHTAAFRFYLDCFDDNARAQRAYEKLGFSRDGRLRGAYLTPQGRRRDLVLMAITRPEWRAHPACDLPSPPAAAP